MTRERLVLAEGQLRGEGEDDEDDDGGEVVVGSTVISSAPRT